MVMTQLDPNGLLAATAIVIIVTIVALTNYAVKWKRGELPKKKKKVLDSPPGVTPETKTITPEKQTSIPSTEVIPETSKSDKENSGV